MGWLEFAALPELLYVIHMTFHSFEHLFKFLCLQRDTFVVIGNFINLFNLLSPCLTLYFGNLLLKVFSLWIVL